MVIVNIKKEDSKKAFKKEAVFKVPKIKGYPTIRIEKGCDFQRNTNFSYSSQPLKYYIILLLNYLKMSYISEIQMNLNSWIIILYIIAHKLIDYIFHLILKIHMLLG